MALRPRSRQPANGKASISSNGQSQGAHPQMSSPTETSGTTPGQITSIAVYNLTLELRVPFTTSFGTYKTMQRPFVVIETADGLRGLGEIPTLNDPAYKAEADTPSVLT